MQCELAVCGFMSNSGFPFWHGQRVMLLEPVLLADQTMLCLWCCSLKDKRLRDKGRDQKE